MDVQQSSRSVFLFVLIAGLCPSSPHCTRKKSAPADTQGREFVHRRVAMVEEQIQARGVGDSSVIQAMKRVPRHLFVPLLRND